MNEKMDAKYHNCNYKTLMARYRYRFQENLFIFKSFLCTSFRHKFNSTIWIFSKYNFEHIDATIILFNKKIDNFKNNFYV